jgi:NADH:ubiquinone reductase (H+-translocating)
VYFGVRILELICLGNIESNMTMSEGKQRIVILGGGFGGAYTAMYLARAMKAAERDSIEVTIVSSDNYIVFQPLLPEVVSGTIETYHAITPIRRFARRAQLYTRRVEAIDLENRRVRLAPGFLPKPVLLEFDHLVICLGTRLNYALVPGMKEHGIPFKYLGDALRLRNETVRALEEADNETDPDEKKKLLTFVVGGGGFSGVECIAELNDFLMRAVAAYRNLKQTDIRCVLLQSSERILPELGENLAAYAHAILEKRGVEIRLNTRLAAVSADGVLIQSAGGGPQERIASRTVVVTVPAAPHPLVASLPCALDRGRIRVTPNLDVPGVPGVWALGDCAAVPQKDGITSPPTAQHALRQARTCARNILATIRGEPLRPFTFTGLGKLASLGRQSAVADVLGIRMKGFLAWLFWRSVYLSKFPGIDRRIRIASDWLLDLLLPRDITQIRVSQPDAVIQEHFHAGETIFDQGDFGTKLYVVVKGEVEIVSGGKRLAALGPGEIFGEVALVSDHARTATVRAATDVDVVTVSRAAFQRLVAYLPGVRGSIEDAIRRHGIDIATLDVSTDDEE